MRKWGWGIELRLLSANRQVPQYQVGIDGWGSFTPRLRHGIPECKCEVFGTCNTDLQ
jgi:hypothetical protein